LMGIKNGTTARVNYDDFDNKVPSRRRKNAC
jgi:hypothetical protein